MKRQLVSREMLDKMCELNSCEHLAEDKAKGIIRYQNKDFVIVGSSSSGMRGNICAWAIECVLKQDYKGILKPMYSAEQYAAINANKRERGYNGQMFNRDGKTYVCFGEKTIFESDSAKQEQLSIFDL